MPNRKSLQLAILLAIVAALMLLAAAVVDRRATEADVARLTSTLRGRALPCARITIDDAGAGCTAAPVVVVTGDAN
jgi:hypothetical protein